LSNKWVSTNTPYSWGYFDRADVPVHFDIAEGWTVGDMYQVSEQPAYPLISGSLGIPGGRSGSNESQSSNVDEWNGQQPRIAQQSRWEWKYDFG